MRDIGTRIQRYRLSRYAAPVDPLRRRLRWVALMVMAWAAWAGLLSDHSFFRIWRLEAEQRALAARYEEIQAETRALEAQRSDPTLRRETAERLLRERSGMARPGEIIYRIEDGPDSLGR